MEDLNLSGWNSKALEYNSDQNNYSIKYYEELNEYDLLKDDKLMLKM